uniref:Tc1-like transposase DDE domain-containing protein n=1 Tax=Corethron hystrix TaxID=216773 RepID=A0A7S1BV17_9STRA|mmetsp:Transcript_40138/g.94340  ORF Transcript_40138/g.94340 Transcript_40138/m.94340 type:complete len:243 (+) Transcript_40138:408-1136(+)
MGKKVNQNIMACVLKKARSFSSNLRFFSAVPVDKFRPENVIKAGEFINTISKFLLEKLKCVDEKLLWNTNGISRKVRRNPLTGVVPTIITNGNFRNSYKVLGICRIDCCVSHLFFEIHKDNSNSDQYNDFVLEGISFAPCVLISDNVPIYLRGACTSLEDYLWEEHKILILYLPARSLDWNPIKLAWSLLIRGLQIMPHTVLNKYGTDIVTHTATDVLSNISHHDVWKTYKKCFLKQFMYVF